MELFPEVLRFEVQAYMKPSEILSEYPIEIQMIYLSNNNLAWKFWIKQGYTTFGISSSEFKNTPLKPYERYLQLYTATGELDYGSEKYKKLADCIELTVEKGNLSLLEYFFSELKMSDFVAPGALLEHKDHDVIEEFVNFYYLYGAAGEDPNFPEVLDLLMKKGLNKRNTEIAWIIHFLKNKDYKSAASLISNDKDEKEYPLANEAFDYALSKGDLSFMKRLVEDFKLENRGDYLIDAVGWDDPVLIQYMIEAFHLDNIGELTRAYWCARDENKNRAVSWFKERYPQLFGNT